MQDELQLTEEDVNLLKEIQENLDPSEQIDIDDPKTIEESLQTAHD